MHWIDNNDESYCFCLWLVAMGTRRMATGRPVKASEFVRAIHGFLRARTSPPLPLPLRQDTLPCCAMRRSIGFFQESLLQQKGTTGNRNLPDALTSAKIFSNVTSLAAY